MSPNGETRDINLKDVDAGQLVGHSLEITDNQTAKMIVAWLMLDEKSRELILAVAKNFGPNA